MKKIVVLFVVLVMVFAITIPAAAGGNNPANGNGPVGPIGPGDGTGPIGGLGPIGGNTSGSTVTGNRQGQQEPRGNFAMTGKIAAVGANTVTINVLRGSQLVKAYFGIPVDVTVTPQTRYLSTDGTTVTTIGFADLQVGQAVSVNGTVANNVWTVSRITVGATLSCLP